MSRNRREPEEEGGGYSWMDTYGDLVTLLLCFFVLLYSFSSMDSKKWQELVGAFSGSSAVSVNVMDVETVTKREVQVEGVEHTKGEDEEGKTAANVSSENKDEFDELYDKIKLYIDENDLASHLSVEKQGDVIVLRFKEAILFNSGEAVILEAAKPILDHVISVISQNIDSVSMIRIEGHTDNVPIHTAQFNSNWELSMARASSALRYFIDAGGIDVDKLSAAAYGEYQPVESNDTAEGRAGNRRVDFVIEKADDGTALSSGG